MSARLALLATLALGLGGLLAWQNWPEAGAPEAAPPPPAAPAARLNPVAALGEAAFAALFDHPLFDPARSPSEAPLTEPQAPPTTLPEPPAAPPRPVLRGTVTSPWPGGAYLGDDQGGPMVFLRPGQSAMGLALEEVQPDRAIFQSAGGEVTLILPQAPPAPPQTGTPVLPALP